MRFPMFGAARVMRAPLADVMADVTSEKKEKKSADKKYVQFSKEEWASMEAKQGKKIDPVDVKKIVLGIFEGRYSISVKTAAPK